MAPGYSYLHDRPTRGLGSDHEQRRTQIADAVLNIVAARGLAAVSLTEVAATAGVSAGRVQHYFHTKQELIEAAFERANELASLRIQDHPDADSPLGMLTVVVTELIPHDETTTLHLRVRQSFTALALVDEEIATRLRVDYTRLHERLAALIAAEQDRGTIPVEIESRAAAVALVALAEGLAYYVLIGVTNTQQALHTVLAEIAELTNHSATPATAGPR